MGPSYYGEALLCGSGGENIQSLEQNSFIAPRKKILSIQSSPSSALSEPETQFVIAGGLQSMGKMILNMRGGPTFIPGT